RARTDRRRALWRRAARRALSRADVSPAGARRVDARRRRGGRAPPGGHRGAPVTDAARDKEQLFERARRTLANDCPAEPRPYRHQRSFFVPGRLEVLGKHTDYAGGRSLLCTVERGICLVAAPRDDDRIRIVDAADGSTVACRIDPNLPSPVGDWSNYPLTVVRRVARNFPAARRGVDMALVSDLPAAAGMSSSSALMIATFLALADANAGAARDRYNRASLATQRILSLWREATRRDDRSLAAAVRSDGGASDRIREILRHSADREFTPALLLNRFDQFVEESDVLVPAVVDLFARGEIDRLGALVDRSQDAAERLLGNQIDETVGLARSARALGALASSAFGAGFGGSVWALVTQAAEAEFEARWATEYRRR